RLPGGPRRGCPLLGLKLAVPREQLKKEFLLHVLVVEAVSRRDLAGELVNQRGHALTLRGAEEEHVERRLRCDGGHHVIAPEVKVIPAHLGGNYFSQSKSRTAVRDLL